MAFLVSFIKVSIRLWLTKSCDFLGQYYFHLASNEVIPILEKISQKVNNIQAISNFEYPKILIKMRLLLTIVLSTSILFSSEAQINLKQKLEKKADQTIDNLLFGKKKKQTEPVSPTYDIPVSNQANYDPQENDNDDYTPGSTSFEGVSGNELIHFSLLIDLLPETAAGIPRSEKPDGSIMRTANLNISMGSKFYENKNQKITITLSDYKDAAMIFSAQAGQFYEYESTDGYMKQITVSGYNGWVSGDTDNEETNLSLSVKERYLLLIEGNGLTEAQLKQIANSVDLNKLP